jgi:RNA polymerase sigma-70 factor, ECF subfamily
MVFGLARRLLGDRSVAEDVVQEVFVALWKYPERFSSERGSLRAYLGVQARRRAIDVLRSGRRRSLREQRQADLNTFDTGPEGSLGVTELSEAVRDAISRLPEDQREAVELAYFGTLTQVEIARHLGIPEGTAKSRLRLAQAKLRAWLDPSLLEIV